MADECRCPDRPKPAPPEDCILDYKVPEFPPPCDKKTCENPPCPPCPPIREKKCCRPCQKEVYDTCSEQLAEIKRFKPAVFKPDQPVMICECRPPDQQIKRTTREDIKCYVEPSCPPCPPKPKLKKCGCKVLKKAGGERKPEPNKRSFCDSEEEEYALCTGYYVYQECKCDKYGC